MLDGTFDCDCANQMQERTNLDKHFAQLTQKCAITFTLNERSIKWSGVSSKCMPDTTPALLISKETCKQKTKKEKNQNKKIINLVTKNVVEYYEIAYCFLWL